MATDVTEGRRRRRSAARVAFTVVLCLTVVGAIVARNALKSKATPPPPLPSPNGYDDLIRAAALIKGSAALIERTLPNRLGGRQADPELLRPWVVENAEAIRVAREGLAKDSRVPVVYKADLTEMLGHASGCRMVGRLLAAEAEVAIVDRRPADAARAFIDILRLARAAGRGGLPIDAQMSWAIESSAVDGLRRIAVDLTADGLRAGIAALGEADRTREDYDTVRNADRYWAERAVDFKIRFWMKLTGMDAKLRAPADDAAIAGLEKTQLACRRLALDYATRLYTLVKGAEPDDPSALVPDFIDAIPLHPITSRPITEVE